MGITTINPPPSEVLRTFPEIRDNIIFEATSEDVENAIEKSKVASTPRTKINAANKGLLKVKEMKKELNNKVLMDALEGYISQYIAELELNSYLDAAKKAEFKGNKKKALDQYQEALYYLEHNENSIFFDDDKKIEIRNRIEQIGSK